MLANDLSEWYGACFVMYVLQTCGLQMRVTFADSRVWAQSLNAIRSPAAMTSESVFYEGEGRVGLGMP